MPEADDMRPSTFAYAWRAAERVDGWLTEAQGRALFDAACDVEPGNWIVEIGSHCGRSTLILAAAKRDGVKLLAVDPFDDPRWGGGADALIKFEGTLSSVGLLEEVTTFRGVSAEASRTWERGPVGMLFVDGAHDRFSVLADIDGWAPHLAVEAKILFHDAFSSPGVTVALFERYFGRAGTEYVGASGSLASFRKSPTNGLARIRSSMRMLAYLFWFARNVAVKIAIKRQWTLLQRLLRHRGTAFPY